MKLIKSSPIGWVKISYFLLFTAILCALISFILFRPYSSANMAIESSGAVHRDVTSSMKNSGKSFAIEIMRENIASSIIHDFALWLTPIVNNGAEPEVIEFIMQQHNKDVANAVSAKILGKCTVIASADSSVVKSLSSKFDSNQLAWLTILYHESAHCVRNIAEYRQDLVSAGKTRSYNPYYGSIFAAHINEAYADAFAIIAISNALGDSKDKNKKIREISTKLKEWRRDSYASPVYMTNLSIDYAVDLSLKMGSNKNNWDALAMTSALYGAREWLAFMEISEDEIDMNFIELMGFSF